jgi:hypothetical protein
MPQLFHRSTNVLAPVSIFGIILLVAVFFWIIYAVNDSPYFNFVGVPRRQPVQFSHKHHVQDDGIDCRYCHTTVETQAFAGMPPTHTCMTCHSQIWAESPALAPVRQSYSENTPIVWQRVHDLPDYVYFNHAIHVKKGFACIICHGRVDLMPLVWKAKPLNMVWCLSCHRSPELYVRPREYVFDMKWTPREDQLTMGRRLVKQYGIRSLTDCYTCHR